jgi:hypothetical protein
MDEPTLPPAGEFEAAAREFQERGFVVIPQFLPQHELAEALAQLENYFHTVLPRMPASRAFLGDKGDLMSIRQIDFAASPDVAPDVDTSYFLQFPRRPRYLALATACLGEKLSPKPGDKIVRPPSECPGCVAGSIRAIDWIRDAAFGWSAFCLPMVSAPVSQRNHSLPRAI